MTARLRVVAAMSGGVDSAVAASRMVEAGHLGKKSGKGFYDYTK